MSTLRANLTTAVCALCAAFAGVSSAVAQAPGVHIDPGGPAGKEYEIPAAQALDQTGAETPREQAVAPTAGPGGDPPAAGTDPRLFGVGIEQGRAASEPAGESAPPDGARPAAPKPAEDRPSWSSVAGERGGDSPLWLLPAIAVGVLASAGALALALRRGAARPT
jgi:hypothetical protein